MGSFICRHIRTWKNKWKAGILINNHQEVPVSIICRERAFEVDVDPLEWLSGFDEGNPLWTVELRFTLGTLSNRRRRPDDGNGKRDISFETSLRMYNTL